MTGRSLDVTDLLQSLPWQETSLWRGDRETPGGTGNKFWKLMAPLEQARRLSREAPRPCQLVSFGGPWSNHLHALSAAARRHRLPLTVFVRGSPDQTETAMLRDLRRDGTQIRWLSRQDYRNRHDVAWREALAEAEGLASPRLIIPEGGSDRLALPGLRAWAERIVSVHGCPDLLVLPVGSGGTLAGLRAALPARCHLVGISAVRDASLPARIAELLPNTESGPWTLWDSHVGPGFGRLTPAMEKAIRALEHAWQVPLDPIYTGKMALAVQARFDELRAMANNPRILLLHTGGLQGRRGMGWPAAETRPEQIRYAGGAVANSAGGD